MQRETTIAIIIGFFLGFGIAAGIFFLPDYIKKQRKAPLPAVLDEGKTHPSPKEQLLSIIVPTDNQKIFDEKLKVNGKTKPNSIIVLQTSEEDIVLKVDPNGSFEQELTLSEGTQPIIITSHLPDGERETIKRTILVYPKEKQQ